MNTFRAVVVAVALPMLFLVGPEATAQSYPSKPIRIVVGSPAGGNNDLQARLYSQKLTESLGQPAIVDIRAGAGGIIAAAFVAKSAPDGYTLMLASTQFLTAPLLATEASYNPLKDFAPVILVNQAPIVLLVHPSLPVRSVSQLISLAKSKPAGLTFGAGLGNSNYFAAELFKLIAKVDILFVGYKGAAPSVTGLMGGEVQMAFPVLSTVRGHIKSGRLRALGVSTVKRAESAPEIPTIAESGLPGYEATPWSGVTAPLATPKDVIEKLNVTLNKAFDNPAGRESLMADGSEFVGGTPQHLGAVMQSESDKWAKLFKVIGLTSGGSN